MSKIASNVLALCVLYLASACAQQAPVDDGDDEEGGADDGSDPGGGDVPDPPLPPGPGTTQGQLGDACAADGDCAGGLCITRPGYPSYCSRPCTAGQADGGYAECAVAYAGTGNPQCTIAIDTTGDGAADAFGCEALCADSGQSWACAAGQVCQSFTINGVNYGACIPGGGGTGGGGGGDTGGGDDGGGGGGGSSGGGGGGASACARAASGHSYEVVCEGSADAATCECYLDHELVETCQQDSLSCWLPGGTCCSGF